MKNLCLVSLGGAFGAACRYLLSHLCAIKFETLAFPIGTFFINVIGSLALGFIAAHYNNNSNAYLFLGIGLCGGFTTFSSFSKETFDLINQQQIGMAFLYAMLSVVLGSAAFFLGLYLQKLL